MNAGEYVGTIPFYLKSGEIDTSLWYCQQCGTYTRDADFEDPTICGHFEVASYTDPAAEERLRQIRSGYFSYLAALLEEHGGRSLRGLRILDVGTAFGHFLERLRDVGAEPEGVEIVERLRQLATQRGLTVHSQIPGAEGGTFDVITAIDSLYYAHDPLALLERLRTLLRPGGFLVIRVANRAWLLDMLRVVGSSIGRDRFGDAKFNFSVHGIAFLLERAGIRAERIVWLERGKADPRAFMRMYYRVSAFLSEYLSLRVSPGMIVVARPES
jgi:SAM-dependent methyltransferase